jgi:hypothetical protein
MKQSINEIKRMQQLAGIIEESQLITENNIVTNYTVDRESERAVLVKIPYVTNNGDEKSLSVWVPKSTLETNNGVPTWIVQKHLETLRSKGYRYDASNIMRTLGKTAADIAATTSQKKPEQPIFWDFQIDNKAIEFGRARLSKDDINKFTKLIKYTDNKRNTREEAQQVIDKIVSEYNLDKLPLVVWKTIIDPINPESDKLRADYYTDMDPFKFNNVSTKEDLSVSQYYTTPKHLRIL